MKFVLFLIVPFILMSCAKPQTKTDGAKKSMKSTVKKVESKSSESDSTAVDTSNASEKVVCRLGKDERTLFLTRPDGGGCDVVYTKWGESNVVASAKNELSYCDRVYEKIKGNLTTAGFMCE